MTTAAATIREARLLAHLTQGQLAERANVTQSVISAYESRRREPSVETLRRVVESAGFDLSLSLTPVQPRSALQVRVHRSRQALLKALSDEGATRIRLFGSTVRGEDGPSSDVDLLVDVAESVGLFALGRMRTAAEQILGVTVDIVPSSSLKADVRRRVLAEALPL